MSSSWVTSVPCFCKDFAWVSLGDVASAPLESIGGGPWASLPGLSREDTAMLAAALVAVATFIFLALLVLCCLCPLCGAGALTAGVKKFGSAYGKKNLGFGPGDTSHYRHVKLPRAWLESFRGVPSTDLDAKLREMEDSGWAGVNDTSWNDTSSLAYYRYDLGDEKGGWEEDTMVGHGGYSRFHGQGRTTATREFLGTSSSLLTGSASPAPGTSEAAYLARPWEASGQLAGKTSVGVNGSAVSMESKNQVQHGASESEAYSLTSASSVAKATKARVEEEEEEGESGAGGRGSGKTEMFILRKRVVKETIGDETTTKTSTTARNITLDGLEALGEQESVFMSPLGEASTDPPDLLSIEDVQRDLDLVIGPDQFRKLVSGYQRFVDDMRKQNTPK